MTSQAEIDEADAKRSETGKLREGDTVAGRYRVDRALGEGGMGVVYAATNLLTRKRVAIKLLLERYASEPDSVARFLREAQAAGRIHHPNVVDVYDVGQDGPAPFLVMELLRGRPLTALLGTPLAPESAISLLMPAMRGIAAAHAEGVVHRDLKPDNVFLCEDAEGRVVDAKVLDFGISKARTDDEIAGTLTKTGAVMGTPAYMSLEQIRGLRDLDVRTDVYSLGVILYEALTGDLPFRAETFPALAVEIATASIPSMRSQAPAVEPALERVVLRAIARDRKERFADIASLARALEPFAGGARFEDVRNALRIEPSARVSAGTATTVGLGTGESVGAISSIREPLRDSQLMPEPRKRSSILLFAIAGLVAAAALALVWFAFVREQAPPSEVRPAVASPASPAPLEPAPPAAPQPVDVTPPAVPIAEVPIAQDPPPSPHPRVPRGNHRNEPRRPPVEPTPHTRTGVRTNGVSIDDF